MDVVDVPKPKKAKKVNKKKPKYKPRRARSYSRSYSPSPSRRYRSRSRSYSRTPSARSSDEDIVNVDLENLDIEEAAPATVKHLYEGPLDEDECPTWLDEPPQELAEVAQRKAKRNAYAVVIRHVKSIDDTGEKTYSVGTLMIQSDLLKSAMREVLKDYPNAGLHSKRPTFRPPFQAFYHRWNELEKYQRGCEEDSTLANHMEMLHLVLDTELKPVRSEVNSLTKHGVITFDLLWTLYPPETVVFGKMDEKDHVFIVKRLSHNISSYTKVLDIWVRYIDYDGYDYGWAERTFSTYRFTGETKIAGLELVPKKYHPDAEKLMKGLGERGQKYCGLVEGGYKAYSGNIYPANFGPAQVVEGRMIVDTLGCQHLNPGICPLLKPLNKPEPSKHGTIIVDDGFDYFPAPAMPKPKPAYNYNYNDPLGLGTNYAPAPVGAGVYQPSMPAPLPPKPTRKATELTSEQLPFCRSTIRGFCLASKQWAEFDVDNVQDITWNEEAFDKLVMPQARKRLIRALIQEQGNKEAQFDDLIEGKGLGLIMLLSGPTGTGKTLTAEAISDLLRLPLYVLAASELLDQVDTIENSLQRVFQLAARWKAVVLLDEADAFMQKRVEGGSTEKRERNKRVAAFLRLLEYYKGTLILTTNRPITFDEAFYSRIHLTLRFQPLDRDARRTIWTNFLSPLGTVPNATELEMLSKIDMNGREIKNVVKMAKLLAKNMREALNVRHVEDVINVVQMPGDDGLIMKAPKAELDD